jgi:LPPG:FO 2-phospho-L-lactate transferase
MHLQEYFVRNKCEPRVRGLRYETIESTLMPPDVERSLSDADIVIVCPSNPFISIGPILAVPGLRTALRAIRAKKIVISPIVNGRALKGPTVEMMSDLGHVPSATGVASLYRDFADLFVLDEQDRALKPDIEALGLQVLIADTVMNTLEEKQRLARQVLGALSHP